MSDVLYEDGVCYWIRRWARVACRWMYILILYRVIIWDVIGMLCYGGSLLTYIATIDSQSLGNGLAALLKRNCNSQGCRYRIRTVYSFNCVVFIHALPTSKDSLPSA